MVVEAASVNNCKHLIRYCLWHSVLWKPENTLRHKLPGNSLLVVPIKSKSSMGEMSSVLPPLPTPSSCALFACGTS